MRISDGKSEHVSCLLSCILDTRTLLNRLTATSRVCLPPPLLPFLLPSLFLFWFRCFLTGRVMWLGRERIGARIADRTRARIASQVDRREDGTALRRAALLHLQPDAQRAPARRHERARQPRPPRVRVLP